MIRVTEVSKAYHGHIAVENINIHVDCGEAVGLVGPNGAGKTTLLRMLMGLLSPDCGAIHINGLEIGELRPPRAIGYVPEASCLFENFSCFENLYHHGRIQGMSKSDSSHQARQWLNHVGLESWQNKKAGVLSKGMKQKVALARALMTDPKCLILDEPFSGLDVEAKHFFETHISNACKNGIAVIVSDHELQRIERCCNRIVFMNKTILNEKTYESASGVFVELKYNCDPIASNFKILEGCQLISLTEDRAIIFVKNDFSQWNILLTHLISVGQIISIYDAERLEKDYITCFKEGGV